MKRILALCGLLAPLLASCTPAPNSQLSDQPEIGITQEVLTAYNNDYLGRHLPLAFAVAPNGVAYSYYYCEASRCAGGSQPSSESINRALQECNSYNQGACVIFALGRSAPRKYHLVN